MTEKIKVDKEVRVMSKEWRGTLEELMELYGKLNKAMKENKGIGISAIQIGIPVRVFLAGDPPELFINPKIIQRSSYMKNGWEGCLSCPGAHVKVKRSHSITISYQTTIDTSGDLAVIKRKFTGYDARVIQHEFDHLNGILIKDRGKVYQE
jgi:peptide deformylase